MSLQSKATRVLPQSPQFTPLMTRSTVQLRQSMALTLYARPAAQGNAGPGGSKEPYVAQIAPTMVKTKPKGLSGTQEKDQPQGFNRRLSVSISSQNSCLLPRIRSRAGSDTDLFLHSTPKPAIRPLNHPAVKKFSHFSKVGSVMGRSKANNQDAFFTVSNISPGAEMTVLGVCDGHGVNGHFVSSFLAKQFPRAIQKSYRQWMGREEGGWRTVAEESFKKVSEDLGKQGFDVMCSGSTCVTVIIRSDVIICGNVGDSRAVLAKRNGSSFTAVDLSKDHKPDVEEEKRRILDFGGRIHPYQDEGEDVGPLRVWLKHTNAPGLAMTRAFGDLLGTRIGVISTPETLVQPTSPEDAFVILASDGVWEFITSQEAVDIVGNCRGRLEEACQNIVAEATRRWRQEEECVDDITVVIAELETSI